MTPEDRLRAAMQSRTSRVEPSADALHRIEEKLVTTRQHDQRKRLIVLCSAAAAAIVLVAGILVFTGEGSDDENIAVAVSTTTTEARPTTTETTAKPPPSTSATTAPPTATTGSTPTTAEPTPTTAVVPTTTTVAPPPVDRATPIFPDPSTARRFDAPEALVAAFATEVVGMTDPIVGDFAQGDSRSGEVEVRGFAGGAPTTVFVRRLEDDTWFVLGAVTASIQPDQPAAFDTVVSPLALTGAAFAFEGTVQVAMFADGTDAPVGATFVTGRGDGVLGPYEGQIEFTTPAAFGWLLYTSEGGEDGAPIEFAAVRLRFG
jgi:hypothetical protein